MLESLQLDFNIEVNEEDWEKNEVIMYVKNDKGIIAYRGMSLCLSACCQTLSGLLGY